MKLRKIIEYFILQACIIMLMAGCRHDNDGLRRIQAEIDSISSGYIPDHRLGIAEIKAEKGVAGVLVLKGETTDPDVRYAVLKTLSNSGNKLIDSIIILPDTIKNKKFKGVVTVSVANIKRQPSHSSEMVSQTLLGTPVIILKNETYWYLIQTPDQYIGWVESSSVVPMTSEEITRWKQSDRVITLDNSGWIYTSPGESGVVGDFVAGCILVKENGDKNYTKVRFPDGREGFIRSKSVTDFNYWRSSVKCTEESIVRCAATFNGLPYLWGGTSSRAVDCSGYSQTVYYMNGIILQRDASLQALHGLNVDFSAGYSRFRPGDLLFFGTKDNSRLHVTHVAIYAGDSEYYNSSGRVILNSLDPARNNYSPSRENSLLAVKRVIGVNGDPGIVPVRLHPWY